MVHKRSRAKSAVKVACPHCGVRLWRLNSNKNYIFLDTVQAVMAATGFNRKRAMLLTRQGVYVDHSRWIESFFCPTHGTMWLIVNKDKDTGEHEVRVPNDQEWEKTCGLIDPNQPNPSVSQYSWQSSRGPVVSGSR